MHAQPIISLQIVSLGLASAALIASPPALAGTLTQADGPEILYEEQPVVQPIPGKQTSEPVAAEPRSEADEELELDRRDADRRGQPRTGHGSHVFAPMGYAVGAPVYFPQGAYPHGAMEYPVSYPGGIQSDQIGRDDWLEQCRARYDAGDRRGKKRGRTIGAVAGAAAGGLIGNRVAGRGDRLIGTAIGAGVGGLAGSTAGSAIGESSDRREALDECEAYLIQHEAQWRQMSYGYGPVMLVPIMVPVQQRAVVREYVTEEWVDQQIMVKVPGKTIIRTAPAVKTVPVRTRAGKTIKGS